jgi:broad specificity phosphatase PhoE
VRPLRATRVHLVRHGTTLLNRSHRYRGRIDVPLDQGGWQDAWTAAAALRAEGLVAIYASPLRRARDTARIIADAAELDAVFDLPGLLNVDYGLWEGLTAEEAAARFPVEYDAYQTYAPGAACPGGESLDVAAERVLLSLRMLALLHPGQTVAAVSHAVNVRLALAAVTDRPRHLWRRDLPNGSVTAFDVVGDRIELVAAPATADEIAAHA